MKTKLLPLPPQDEEAPNVKVTCSGTATQAILVAVLRGQGKLPNITLDPNGENTFTFPAGIYLFHVGFVNPTENCTIDVQVETRAEESPFPDQPEHARANAGKPGQLTVDVVV